jgi:short subunit dehydrogenase-like uncharacterized protein
MIIYGSYGFTGELVVAEAVARGHRPVLAGRDATRLKAQAARLGLPYRAVALDDSKGLLETLEGRSVVLHCAGPFVHTAQPMVDACLATGTHYLDITGEIAVFEAAHARDAQARLQGVVVCPGVGFDVIPSDCLAACLHQALPDASHLALGFDSASGLSPGTAKTSVEGLKFGGKVRRAGIITDVPLGYLRRSINFGRGAKSAVSIPWGDVATAYYATGIGNIEVYIPASPALAMGMRLLDPLRPLLGRAGVQQSLKRLLGKRVRGPDQANRERQRTWLWGEVRNAAGEHKTARLQTANGYEVTVHGTLLAVRHLLDYKGRGGYFTTSQLLGERCVEQLPGSGKIVIS